MNQDYISHGYETQSKHWEKFPQQTAGYYTPFMRDNSTCNFQCTLFLKLGSHYNSPT
jgi:hypothetical protein